MHRRSWVLALACPGLLLMAAAFGGVAPGLPSTTGPWVPLESGTSVHPAGATPRSAATFASYGWQPLAGSSGFPQMYQTSIASDPVDHSLVMFGGCVGPGTCTLTNQTWVDANGSWTEIHPALSPSPRTASLMAWDPADGYVLLFGGSNASGLLNDTWAFKNGTWNPVIPSGPSPPPALDGGLAYDPSDREMVLFVGTPCAVGCGTWVYAGGTWTKLALSVQPPNRSSEGFTEDDADNGALLFGGETGSGSIRGDTWLFSHGAWGEVNSSVAPSPRLDPALAWDPSLNADVLYGGVGCASNCSPDNDTWEFQNGTWTEWTDGTTAAPPPALGLVEDPPTRVLILVGACTSTPCSNRTFWGFGEPNPVQVASEGSSCANFTLGYVSLGSGGTADLLNGTYPLRIVACSGYLVGNVTTGPSLIAVLSNGNSTAWSGSVLVQGAGLIQANFTHVASNPPLSGLNAISVLGLTFLELLLVLVAFAAVAGIALALIITARRRARTPARPSDAPVGKKPPPR